MAATVTKLTERESFGGTLFAWVAEITWDATYPAGGEAITTVLKNALGATEIVGVFFSGAAAAAAGTVANVPKWDRVNGKVQLFETGAVVSTDLDEQGTADQSAKKAVVLVLGR